MLESGLVSFLLAQSNVTALISNGLYPLLIPQNASFPCATYQLISTVPQYTNDGSTGFTVARVQIDTWSTVYSEVKAVADAIRTSLDGYRGTFPNGPSVLNIMRDNCTDYFEQTARLFRVQTDWIIQYGQQ